MQLFEEGWRMYNNKEPTQKSYWAAQAFLTVINRLLLRLVIPMAMRNDVLNRLHEGHQGIVKCREHARQSGWWLGLSQQPNELVYFCRAFCKERENNKEPLMSSCYPDRPWQKLGADLFTLGSKTYLPVADYSSRYVEIAQLTPTKSTDVIIHLKSIFAWHGIWETLVADKRPQFPGMAFVAFAEKYDFHHKQPKIPTE